MATPSKETIVKFKADTKDYEERIKALNQSNRMLKQELKLAHEEMKLSGSTIDKLNISLSSLEKQYDLAKQKTKECTDQLTRAKQVWGENSTEATKATESLNRAKIAEAELSNKIQRTTEEVKKAK
ncbi:phage tail tape measure protein, partial [Bacillus cereus]|nr:phage tail tape measure protein [Bacillus cereus]MDA2572756.1 phage tail tape measure protein [Bacillus cereus]